MRGYVYAVFLVINIFPTALTLTPIFRIMLRHGSWLSSTACATAL